MIHARQNLAQTQPDYNADQILETLHNLNFVGHTVPHAWFQADALKKSGKTHHLAIMILSDIVYWYRPTPILEEHTGNEIGYKKKFKADMLQRSYQSFATLLGCSKRQATETIKFLADAGIIHKELRSVKTEMGTIHNVLYIAPNAEAITALQANFVLLSDEEESEDDSYFVPVPSKAKVDPINVPRTVACEIRGGPLRKQVKPIPQKSETYTKNTTKITTKKPFTQPSAKVGVANVVTSSLSEAGLVEVVLDDGKGRGNNAAPMQKFSKPRFSEKHIDIGSCLTESQETELCQHFERLCKGSLQGKITNPSRVLEEIRFCLLDVNSLSNCENSFQRKLRCIVSLLESGRWRTPAKMYSPTMDYLNKKSNTLHIELKKIRQTIANTLFEIASEEACLNTFAGTPHIKTRRSIHSKIKNHQHTMMALKEKEAKLTNLLHTSE